MIIKSGFSGLKLPGMEQGLSKNKILMMSILFLEKLQRLEKNCIIWNGPL